VFFGPGAANTIPVLVVVKVGLVVAADMND